MIYQQEKEIELILTYSCNWNCEYCCVDTHNRIPISKSKIFDKLKQVPEGYNVTLSGGEVGLLDKKLIIYIIEYLENINCTISLNTNGLFLKKYPELSKHFEYVLYHCSEDLIQEPDFDILDNWNVELMLVVTDNNIKNLDKFMKKYNNYIFHIVASTYADQGLDVTLSNPNRYKIMSKRYSNISKESLKRLIIKEKNYDNITYI